MSKTSTIITAIAIAVNMCVGGGCRTHQNSGDADAPEYYVELYPLTFDKESSASIFLRPLQLEEYQVNDILRASLEAYPLRPVSAKTVGLSSVLKEGLYTGYPGTKIQKSEINPDEPWVYPVAAAIRFAPDRGNTSQSKADNLKITVSVDYMESENPQLMYNQIITKEYFIDILPDSTTYMLLPVGALSEIDSKILDVIDNIHIANRMAAEREYLCYLVRVSQGLEASAEDTVIWTEEMHNKLLDWVDKQESAE